MLGYIVAMYAFSCFGALPILRAIGVLTAVVVIL